ncbi:MAG: amine oxidase [Micavibrio sp.]|nr:amine oxidase [Micavibrio sp.]
MKIAIIGTGISGLGAAYLLQNHHDITLFEKNTYIGGHSRTKKINVHGQDVAVDTGFIVFNNWNYPNLLGLFKELKVPYVKSNMSFGVSVDKGWLEYSSNDLFALRNLVRPAYWRMLRDITKFNKQALAYIEKDPAITLGQCLQELKMGAWFKDYYLLAMGAAIWSCPLETIMAFPARTFLRFFKNHGLLSINNRPQWYTVEGGSQEYVKRLTESFRDKINMNCAATKVAQHNGSWEVTDSNGRVDIYDQVIFACHADEAIKICDDLSAEQQDVIGAFSYQENTVILHSDQSFMPKNKKTWASWIYLSEKKQDKNPAVALSYWMNNLQPLNTDTPVIITLNPERRPTQEMIYDEHIFSHPVFDLKAIQAQERIQALQGDKGLWFCGAYQRYGFHEDGLLSAVNIAKKMGVSIPWE